MEPYDQKPNYTSYEKPRHTGKIVLAVVAVAAIALAVGVANNAPESLTPVSETERTAMGGTGVYDDPANAASSIEPAEGEAFRENKAPAPTVGGTAVAPAAQPPGATSTNPTPPTSPAVPTATGDSVPAPAVAVPPPVQTYGSEQECKDATSTACHATECSTAKSLADCPDAEKKSWQAMVPAMDQTAVPEQVNPPLTGQ
jgi:hypothetical protein